MIFWFFYLMFNVICLILYAIFHLLLPISTILYILFFIIWCIIWWPLLGYFMIYALNVYIRKSERARSDEYSGWLITVNYGWISFKTMSSLKQTCRRMQNLRFLDFKISIFYLKKKSFNIYNSKAVYLV